MNEILGTVPLAACPAFDENLDRQVTIEELLQGVLDAMSGCR